MCPSGAVKTGWLGIRIMCPSGAERAKTGWLGIRIMCQSGAGLARNQDKVSEWSDMSTRELLFQ